MRMIAVARSATRPLPFLPCPLFFDDQGLRTIESVSWSVSGIFICEYKAHLLDGFVLHQRFFACLGSSLGVVRRVEKVSSVYQFLLKAFRQSIYYKCLVHPRLTK
jgi:hypothetical protein